MVNKESPVWKFVAKDPTVNKAGNVPATCKCCGCTKTQSPGMWWEHLQEPCNGSKDSELLLKAKEEAGKHFVAIAEKVAQWVETSGLDDESIQHVAENGPVAVTTASQAVVVIDT